MMIVLFRVLSFKCIKCINQSKEVIIVINGLPTIDLCKKNGKKDLFQVKFMITKILCNNENLFTFQNIVENFKLIYLSS